MAYECSHNVVALLELHDGALSIHCGDCMYSYVLNDKEEKKFRKSKDLEGDLVTFKLPKKKSV